MHAAKIIGKKGAIAAATGLSLPAQLVNAIKQPFVLLAYGSIETKMLVLVPILVVVAILSRVLPLIIAKFTSSSSSVVTPAVSVPVPQPPPAAPVTAVASTVIDSKSKSTEELGRKKIEETLRTEEERLARNAAAKAEAAAAAIKAAEDAERERKLQIERELKKKEEQYQQEQRLARWQKQRATEQAATGSTRLTIAKSANDLFKVDEELPPDQEREVIGAAALAASVVGFKFGGPLGAFAFAATANYFGKQRSTKGLIKGTGKAAIGTVDLFKSIDSKFEVVRGVEAAMLSSMRGSEKSTQFEAVRCTVS